MEIIPELKRVPKTYRQLCSITELRAHYGKDLLACLARLSEKQIIKRGFHLPCPNCGTPTWYPLAIVEETVVCPGCSWRFPLPVESPLGSEIQWEYTLNTLVNRAMDQDALVSAIVLRHLSKKRQASCLVPGLEILQSNQVKAEMDFVFVSEQEVFAGECKAGDSLGDKDINTARLAADLGMKASSSARSRCSMKVAKGLFSLAGRTGGKEGRVVGGSTGGTRSAGEAIA